MYGSWVNSLREEKVLVHRDSDIDLLTLSNVVAYSLPEQFEHKVEKFLGTIGISRMVEVVGNLVANDPDDVARANAPGNFTTIAHHSGMVICRDNVEVDDVIQALEIESYSPL